MEESESIVGIYFPKNDQIPSIGCNCYMLHIPTTINIIYVGLCPWNFILYYRSPQLFVLETRYLWTCSGWPGSSWPFHFRRVRLGDFRNYHESASLRSGINRNDLPPGVKSTRFQSQARFRLIWFDLFRPAILSNNITFNIILNVILFIASLFYFILCLLQTLSCNLNFMATQP